MASQLIYLEVVNRQRKLAKTVIPYTMLPQDPQACADMQRQFSRVTADDEQQALVLERQL